MRGNLANGFTVMDWMSKRLRLTSAQTAIYACVYDASLGGTRPAVFTTTEIATLCKVTPHTVRETLKILEEENLIKNSQYRKPGWSVEINTDTLREYHLGGF